MVGEVVGEAVAVGVGGISIVVSGRGMVEVGKGVDMAKAAPVAVAVITSRVDSGMVDSLVIGVSRMVVPDASVDSQPITRQATTMLAKSKRVCLNSNLTTKTDLSGDT